VIKGEREDNCKQPRRTAEGQSPDVVAAKREQRHEHEVLGNDRRGDVDPTEQDAEVSNEIRKGGVGVGEGERTAEVSGFQFFEDAERER
jgi:hypothetical protein